MKVLVVGGGQVALRKITLLKQSQANIHLVSPKVDPKIIQLLSADDHIDERCFELTDLQDKQWVIAATDNPDVNRQVSEGAKLLHCFVNVVDQPELGNFIFPAVLERPPLSIAVSSHGASPVLVRRLRAKLETLIPAGYGHLAALVGRYRKKVQSLLPNVSLRRKFWDSILDGPVSEMVFSGRIESAEENINQALATLSSQASSDVVDNKHSGEIGEVFLIGAGPGDPDLLTFRALRLLQLADVVLYDRLVSSPILAMARRDAEMVYVGKKRADHAVPQEDINQILVNYALQGKRVCRLKGGDPFIFGRGGEEISLIAQHRIPFQIVPGITAASGCASYAGIPLTHRDHAQSVCFVTGHLKDGAIQLDWKSLVQPRQTLVIYMGLVRIQDTVDQLIQAGMSEDMPAAIIEKGTTPDQQVITARLKDFPNAVAKAAISAPTLIIIGDVVKCRDELNWFS